MAGKTYPVEALIPFLTKNETVIAVAEELGMSRDEFLKNDWFRKAYDASVKIFSDHAQDFKRRSNVITQDELREMYGTFLSIMKASKKKYDAARNTPNKSMYAVGPQGNAITLPNFGLNETAESPDDEEFILSLYREDIIGQAMKRWEQEYPDVSVTQFDPALKMAMDVVMQQAKRNPTYPTLMPSELEEVRDALIELVLSYEPARSIFQSTGKAKPKAKKRTRTVDPDPFEKGSYASIGLNEGIDNWSEAKLRQFIKKEFDSHVKKGDYMTKKEVKDMIRKTIVKQYKYLWEKSAFFINQI